MVELRSPTSRHVHGSSGRLAPGTVAPMGTRSVPSRCSRASGSSRSADLFAALQFPSQLGVIGDTEGIYWAVGACSRSHRLIPGEWILALGKVL